jgi:drug/metabolite transporter (DMT)-like permease
MRLAEGSVLGPVLFLAVRFLTAGVVWTLMFPAARRGWSKVGLVRAMIIGVLLGCGLTLQHIGLDRTTAAVSAFLTSLSIVFVPLLSTFALGRPPRPQVWVGVAMATAGVWCMTGATPDGFGLGELLGLLCAMTFSVHLLTVNALVVRDDPFRMTGGPFFVTGLVTLAVVPFVAGGDEFLAATVQTLVRLASVRDIWLPFVLLVSLPTVAAYGLLTFYQPKLDATRAALIYLFEPIFASVYEFLTTGTRLPPMALVGAGLILLANAVVELLGRRRPGVAEADLAPREQV